jgi:hypothetical protein
VVVSTGVSGGSFVIDMSNCNVTSSGAPPEGVIFANDSEYVSVSVINTGNVPVYMDTITMSTNVTSAETGLLTIPNTESVIPVGYYATYPFLVNPIGWPLGVVQTHFVATGNNQVTNSTNVTFDVFGFPTGSASSTTSSSSSSSGSTVGCPFNFQA